MKKLLANKKLITAVFIIYIAVVLKITVFRSGITFDNLFVCGRFNDEIFTDLIRILKVSPSTFAYLFFGNIVWFVPFGFLLPLCRGKGPGQHALGPGQKAEERKTGPGQDTEGPDQNEKTPKTTSLCLKTVLWGLAFSVLIEFLQYMFGTGVTEIDDIILNTFGVWVGVLLFKAVERLIGGGKAAGD